MMKEKKEPEINQICLMLCNDALNMFESHFSNSTSFVLTTAKSMAKLWPVECILAHSGPALYPLGPRMRN